MAKRSKSERFGIFLIAKFLNICYSVFKTRETPRKQQKGTTKCRL